LKATDRTIENEQLKVTLNDAGDISSIIDKKNGNREQLMAPTRLEFLHEEPAQYPAWNMDYEDRMAKPTGYVDGPCEFKVVENGPVRVAIQTIRHAQGSTFTQTYSLDAGSAGNSVRVNTHIDWHTQKCSLEAAFPLAAGAPEASYESAVGVIKRGNNNPKKYEVPQQQWFDVTDSSGKFGTAILNDCKYASDKPDDHTVRLTLLYTPDTTKGGYQDQGTQDLGIHDMVYSIAPHEGSWEKAGIPWTAARLNQPLMAFTTTAHEGKLGKTFEIGKTNKEGVSISALKKAEDSDETIVRLKELNGVEEGPTAVSFAGAILSAREVDGQEREIGPAKVVDGKLIVDMSPFSLRAFAIKLAPPAAKVAPVQTADVAIEYDTAGVGQRRRLDIEVDTFDSGADLDGEGHSVPADMLPPVVTSENIPFKIGPTTAGAKNVLTAKGQTITLPAGYDKVYFLAASTKGDVPAEFTVNGKATKLSIQDWSGYIGQWDARIWVGPMLALTYNWGNKFVGLDAGYIKRDTVAFYSDHRREKNGGNGVYQFCYLYKYGIDLPAGATSITLPNDERIKMFAVTVAKDGHDNVTPGRPLYDTLDDHIPAGPTILPDGGKFDDVTTMTMGHKTYGHEGDTHYTLDGSEPTEQSPVYKDPVVIDQPVTVRARQFTPRGPAGPEVDARFDVNDTTAPKVTAASGLTQEPKATVTFSKAVAKAGAENTGSYKFDPAVEVTAAKLSDDGTSVVLTLEKPLAEGSKLRISGVTDPSPNANKVSSELIPMHVSGALATVDDFTGDGTNTRELKVEGLSGKKDATWTINFFCKPDGDVPDLTPIAGFGTCKDGQDGKGRYICKFAEGVHFWACNQDVLGNTPVDVGAWQMLTATYDGKTLKLYKDGKLLESKDLELADDNATVRLAPADAWGENRHFRGKIHAFTVWPSALSDGAIQGLKSDMPK
jgi:alpha-mannosidase